MSYHQIDYRDSDWFHCELFNGIPLTPEILEKCGFAFKKYIAQWANVTEDYSYYQLADIKIWDDNFTNKSNVVIKYLHQLQNLYFALTGEELTVINPMSENKDPVNINP